MRYFKKYFLAALIFFLAFSTAEAQTIPDIIAEYKNATDPNVKVSLLVKLGMTYQNIRAYRKALDYYKDALNLYQGQDFFTEKSFILKNVALCYEELHEYQEALMYWKEILKDKKNKEESREIITALEKIANISVQNGNYKEAIEYSLLLLPEYAAANNKAGTASVYNNLGSFYKKTGDIKKSEEYFSKCREMIDKENSGINENDLADILLNIGLSRTISGEIDEANLYMTRALEIREKQRKNVEMANVLNYMAATDLIGEYYNSARTKVVRALKIMEQAKDEPRYDEVQIASYRIYCELLLRKKNIKEFKYYNELYNRAKDQLIAKEQKQNLVVLEQQVEIEKKESKIRMIQADKEMKEFTYRKSEQVKEKELIIQSKEIELLKQSRDLQLTRIRNQELDKQRIAQLLEIAGQKSSSLEQQREIDALEKNKEVQLLTIEKQSRENKFLELEKKIREQKLADEAVQRKYTMGLIGLLLIVVVGTCWFLWIQSKNNKILERQNEIIKQSNQRIVQQNEQLSRVNNEISAANEELYQLNEELTVHRENLELQNKELEKAKHTIASQNQELKIYNINLEDIVNSRTEELINTNIKLTKNNNRLEQFGYVVSHNLRGPIARLLGLSSIIDKKAIDDENNLFLDKMVEVTKDLDLIIHDLNQVLEVQKGVDQEYVLLPFDLNVDKILVRLENKIAETKAKIRYDFKAANEVKVVKPYFESILYNLLSNAIKYSKPGEIPEISIVSEEAKEYVLLKISDNGIGIDTEKNKEKLFGLYKRFHTHVEGKGLGLYMVKTQLEAMDGKIELESKPNVGSVFKVYFKKDVR